MSTPRAVVIPFGVPPEGRGLGLGLAAVVHAFVHVEGGGVALAQLQARRSGGEQEPGTPLGPVEAFVPPAAWRDIAGRAELQGPVGVVLTGSFEPPTEGQGTIRLLVFDPRDGRTCARVDAPVDDEHAGATLVGAFERIWSGLGGEIRGVARPARPRVGIARERPPRRTLRPARSGARRSARSRCGDAAPRSRH